MYWRRERDSNPRYGFPHSGFQDRRLRPLGHPSSLRERASQIWDAGALAKAVAPKLATESASEGGPTSHFCLLTSYFVVSLSTPPMYPRSASGIATEPSLA